MQVCQKAETMSDYDTDILTWSERQAALLRRRAAGELINDADLDWPNIAEEIEDVGKSQLRAVESAIVLALRHMLETVDGVPPLPLPAECPVTLDELLDDQIA